MSPEDAAKVWDLQAKAVAGSLELEDEAQAKVAEAYKKAREAQAKATREAMEGGGGGDPMARFQAMREINEKHAADLKAALTEAVGEDQGAKAAAQLAAFDRRTDGMALALSNFDLDDAKLQEAMGHVGAYATGMSKAMEEAFAAMDMEAMRTARQELQTKLDEGMANVLNEEQLKTWKEQTAFRGGRGGRGGPGRAGGGGRPDGGDEN